MWYKIFGFIFMLIIYLIYCLKNNNNSMTEYIIYLNLKI